jgi:hypothetical protein
MARLENAEFTQPVCMSRILDEADFPIVAEAVDAISRKIPLLKRPDHFRRQLALPCRRRLASEMILNFLRHRNSPCVWRAPSAGLVVDLAAGDVALRSEPN